MNAKGHFHPYGPRRCHMGAAIIVTACAVLATAQPAFGYVGPGAGFAVLSSLFVVFAATASAFFAMATWPVRWTIRAIRGRRALARSRIRRCVIVGLDGMDPDLVDGYMERGMLPNLARLRDQGCYQRLGTTAPPLSPVAWSSFTTASNPGKHGIFDFLTYDRKTYAPKLSSVQIGPARRQLKLGKYRIPLGRPELRGLRRGTPFWHVLGKHGIFSTIIRVPITFPPEKFNGLLLSAMCAPDLRGTQGTFTLYTTREVSDADGYAGDIQRFADHNGRLTGLLMGPPNTLIEGTPTASVPFTLDVNSGKNAGVLTLDGQRTSLKCGVYSDWVGMTFRLAPGVTASGICRFLLLRTEPHVELYVTPVQIDPENPAMPIAHPAAYSVYLAKRQGQFATLGIAEDTSALNEGAIDDNQFLAQCLDADTERESMFLDAIRRVKRGLCVAVFDGTDRIQHMFWRYLEKDHPANKHAESNDGGDVIPEHYRRCDELVGKVMRETDDGRTLLFVISDHGFKSFRRSIDLNRWLIENGYMHLKDDACGDKYLADVDWSRTQAFAIGLAGIYLNITGREARGIVPPGEPAKALRDEICSKLRQLKDDNGAPAVKNAYNAHRVYRGPYSEEGPDVIVGYAEGYRVSWDAAVGRVSEKVFSDNTKAWSGDHCIDPTLVPGVMFCNQSIEADSPRLMDIGPTALDMFGVSIPKWMDGRPLRVYERSGSAVDKKATAA